MKEYVVYYQDRQFVAVQSSKKNIFASDLNDAAEKYFSMLSNREAVSGVRWNLFHFLTNATGLQIRST